MIVSYRIFLASDELPADMIREVGALTSKDIVKEIRDSKVEFFIGPFSNHTEAGNLAQALRDRGFTQVIVQTVNN
jgi:cobalamin biosynthesis Co2+ chelatase CbiK